MSQVKLTVDGKEIHAAAGSLLIDVCKSAGIEIPSFCYYPGLSLQGACRMCLVEIARVPKLQTACTTPVAEGMVVTTESPVVRQSRKAMLEFVLQNHPLDCPVCDAGGQCELQDATFRYGAAESRLVDIKNHRDEQQWSPIVFFDRPRCIMCYRCVRVCGEGMDVWALGIANRNSSQLIVPNKDDHLECEECGMCIDICPVGALTSGPYRYKTRPWEMKHVGTICTHCGDGCTTTLGVRPVDGRMRIIRGTNRDKSGINGDFLCIKGRYAFDFVDHPQRLTTPLVRVDGELRPASWDQALAEAARLLEEARKGPGVIGVIGSNHSTNEENYILQKFARTVLHTNNIDHRRTADFTAFFSALAEFGGETASMAEVAAAPAILLIGSDPTYRHPLLAWQIRRAVRLHGARLHIVHSRRIKLCRQATQFIEVPAGGEADFVQLLLAVQEKGVDPASARNGDQFAQLLDNLGQASGVVIVFGSELTGTEIRSLVRVGSRLNHARFICLGDGPNSRGAADMGVLPDRLPGYETDRERWSSFWKASIPELTGMNLQQMLHAAEAGTVSLLYLVGADPVGESLVDPRALGKAHLIVNDLFLTRTAAAADVVFPTASVYEKSGTFTNTCGDLQVLRKAADMPGVRSDLEIILQVARMLNAELTESGRGPQTRAELGESRGVQSGEVDQHAVWMRAQRANLRVSSDDPDVVLREIQRALPGYEGIPVNFHRITASSEGSSFGSSEPVQPYDYDLFSSPFYGRYSATLHSVLERRLVLPGELPQEDLEEDRV
jgi:NADH-quinone oxidoreductase subunit G